MINAKQPMVVDSHCHLDRLDLSGHDISLSDAIPQWHESGIGHFLCVSINLDDFPSMLQLVRRYSYVSCSVGVHPSEPSDTVVDVAHLVSLAKDEKVVAIGETGLDYYYNKGDLSWQQERFRSHIAAAKIAGKPVIIHMRDAAPDTIAILKQEQAGDAGGVFHCFTDTWETAKKALDLGFYISFSGIVTFSNADNLRQVAKKVPADRILVETDAPYLAPVPKRGKPNIPFYVHYVVEKLAQIRNVSLQDLAYQTTANFGKLFAFEQQIQ